MRFNRLEKEFVKNIVNGISRNKAAGVDIPMNLLKESTFVLPFLVRCVNKALAKSKFPDPLKQSNKVPVHKKEDPTG